MNVVNILNGQRQQGSPNCANRLNGQSVPDSELIRTYDNAALSGAPVLLRFFCDPGFYYLKAYPTISAAISGSAEAPLDSPYEYQDSALSGTPVVFGFHSAGREYYAKAYLPAAATFVAGDVNFRPGIYADAALSGAVRIAKATVAGVAYYFSVYPTKS